jgi:hypothetical protein
MSAEGVHMWLEGEGGRRTFVLIGLRVKTHLLPQGDDLHVL